jgi:anti-sigma-K factor RskA
MATARRLPRPTLAVPVALDPLEGSGTGRAVVAERETDRVRLQVGGLPADRDGRFHELWLLPAEGEGDPVAVGRFRVGADGRATVTFRLPDDPDRYRFLDVSVEEPDGDPKHSGRSVLRAPV